MNKSIHAEYTHIHRILYDKLWPSKVGREKVTVHHDKRKYESPTSTRKWQDEMELALIVIIKFLQKFQNFQL